MEDVASILERERTCLETLLFKLVETRLILASGDLRFLSRATAEVDRARTRCREIDLLRAATVARHQPGASLRQLAASAPEPWPVILRDHHEAISPLIAEVELTGYQNTEVAERALARLRQRVPVAHGSQLLIDLDAVDRDELNRLANDAALTSVLASSARLRMPDLLAFLR
jgi:hypothetical protein